VGNPERTMAETSARTQKERSSTDHTNGEEQPTAHNGLRKANEPQQCAVNKFQPRLEAIGESVKV
jgi:hypothetical protein